MVGWHLPDTVHASVTRSRLLELAVERADEHLGVCLACGADRACCEPDARGYACDDCGAPFAFGAEEALLACPDLPAGESSDADAEVDW